MEILIIGAGAIGGVLGAHLARGGEQVVFCDLVQEHVEKINAEGLRIEGPAETFNVQAPAYTPEQLLGRGKPLETVFLCVKAQHTAEALAQVIPLLSEQTQVVSFQNGLCENIISKMIGKERTIGCFVNFSADYLEPGRILYGGRSALVLGELDATISPRILDLQQRLRTHLGYADVSENIWGYLWGKLSYAALLFATAFVDETMADVVRSEAHRAALLELCSEVLEVADREGVTPLGFDDWEPALVYPREARDEQVLAAQLEKLATRMANNKKTKSGIWRDLAVRKRKTEVDFQLTPVIEIGQQYGLELPLTRAVVEMIKKLETGEIEMSWANLDALNVIDSQKGELRTR